MRAVMSIVIFFALLCIPQAVNAESNDDGFTISTINDSIFQRMKGKSFADNCATKREDLRHLCVLHYDFNGNVAKGELVCNKAIAQDLIDIFRELYKAKYQIARMRLIDEYNADDETSMRDNNTSCFNYRKVAGTKTVSKHGRGMAIDINPLNNPCVKVASGRVQPATGKQFVNRSKAFAHKIDKTDLCYKLFIKHGFRWGGAWRSTKDYQHFEK